MTGWRLFYPIAEYVLYPQNISVCWRTAPIAISPQLTSTKNMSISKLWSDREVLLPDWCVALDYRLDEILHLKMTIAEKQ